MNILALLLLGSLASAAEQTPLVTDEQRLDWLMSQPENVRILGSDLTEDEKFKQIRAQPQNQEMVGTSPAVYGRLQTMYLSIDERPSPGEKPGQGFFGRQGAGTGNQVSRGKRGALRTKPAIHLVAPASGKKAVTSKEWVSPAEGGGQTDENGNAIAVSAVVGAGHYISGPGVKKGVAGEKKSAANMNTGGGGGGGGSGPAGTASTPLAPSVAGATNLPVLTGVSPNTVTIGMDTMLILSGNNFASGATLRLVGPTTVTRAVNSVTKTEIRSGGTLAGDVSPGTYEVQVTNPDGKVTSSNLTVMPEITLAVGQTLTRPLSAHGYDFIQLRGSVSSGQVNADLGAQPAGIHLMWKASVNGFILTNSWPTCVPPALAEYNSAYAAKIAGTIGPITLNGYQDWITDGGIGSGVSAGNYCVGFLMYNDSSGEQSYSFKSVRLAPPPITAPPAAPTCSWGYSGFSPAPPAPSTSCGQSNVGQAVGPAGWTYTCACSGTAAPAPPPAAPAPPPAAPSCSWRYLSGFGPVPPVPTASCSNSNSGQVTGSPGWQYTCVCQ
jgi:hypothetical protein